MRVDVSEEDFHISRLWKWKYLGAPRRRRGGGIQSNDESPGRCWQSALLAPAQRGPIQLYTWTVVHFIIQLHSFKNISVRYCELWCILYKCILIGQYVFNYSRVKAELLVQCGIVQGRESKSCHALAGQPKCCNPTLWTRTGQRNLFRKLFFLRELPSS